MNDRLPDVRPSDIRAVNRLTGHLIESPDLATLGRELIRGSEKILPADFMVWNEWTHEMDEILGFEANHGHYREGLEQHSAALNATIHHHPVIVAGHLESAWIRPQRISDYQSDAAFRSNPLYQEVYRHVDSRHQIAYNAARLDDSRIILSWNLWSRDFTDREVQLLHLIGLQVGVISRRIEERRRLREVWKALARGLAPVSGVIDPAITSGLSLGGKEGRILAGLIRGEKRADIADALQWRRDTLDRHLGEVRERFGHENTAQFLQALASLRPERIARDPVS
ncbi:MAG: hypothetical protein V4819_22950 [Verrucomicrobiota bacterium]